ncbi:hypothetical protein HMPREF0972_00736 [Actinomyces sp. oral taxon 848 str. F0332]|nr:hypothetical protein HMPREF0972_00736 [Actinomyces sp. oral taxon 848 str. F0332]
MEEILLRFGWGGTQSRRSKAYRSESNLARLRFAVKIAKPSDFGAF